MEEASRFEGHWEVDHAVSDSIEPMLKAMGVSLMIRKIAKSVKVTQEIRVKGDQFIVNNISKHAQDKTIHYMNAGPRTILTNRGEKVVDTCTFAKSREFPIQIQAVLPGDKGATIDKRKIVPDGKAFIQHLIFKPPPSKALDTPQSPDPQEKEENDEILMIRTFRRVDSPAPSTAESPQVEPEPAVTPPPLDTPQSDSSAPVNEASLSVSATSGSKSGSPMGESREASLHRWMLVVTAAAAANVVVFLLQEGWVDSSDGDETGLIALGIVIIPGLLFRLLRVKVSAGLATGLWGLYIAVVLLATEQAIAQGAVLDVELARLASWTFCAMAGMLCVLEQVDGTGALSRRHWIFLTLLTSSATAAPLIAGNRFVDLGVGSGWGQKNLGMAVASFLFTCYAGLRVVSCFVGKEEGVEEEEEVGQGGAREEGGSEGVDLLVAEFRIVDGIYTQYKVCVSCAEGEWEVWRRYSQFHALRAALRKHTGAGVLPPLPPKTMFNSMADAFLEQRRERLEEFMQELVDMNNREMARRKLVRNFLGLGQGRGKKGEGDGRMKMTKMKKKKKDPNEDEEVLGSLKRCKVNMEKAFTCGDEDGWTFIGKKHGVQCYLKESNGLTFTKGVGVVDAPADVIVNYTADMSTRKTYDDLHKKDTVLHVLDHAKIGQALDANVDLAEIRHSEFKSPFVVISPRDTVMAQCRIRGNNGVLTTLLASVKGYKKPTSKYVRANVLSAGIKLEPVPGNPEKCIMTNVQCMDPNGAIPQWVVKAVAPERCAMSAMLNKHVSKKDVWTKYSNPNPTTSTAK